MAEVSFEIALRWMSWDLRDDKSTLVQAMAGCHKATNHYLSEYWPRSMSPYVVTRPQWVNSLRPGDANMRHYNKPTLLQIMACRLFGARPLSEPVLQYCQLDLKEHISVTFFLNSKFFIQGIVLENVCNGGHFVLALVCLLLVPCIYRTQPWSSLCLQIP